MNETQEEKESDWARLRLRWAEDGTTVMHVVTRVVGKVTKYYDGDAEKWKDPNGVYVVTPVLALDNGNAFVASEQKDFLALDEGGAAFYKAANAEMAICVSKLAMGAAMKKIPLADAAVLLSSLLRDQARHLEAAVREALTKKAETPE